MLNVLYVEDDANSRDVLRLIQRINPGQFNLTVFEDSRDFEQKLLALDPQPTMILLDIHMQPHTGFEMLQMIRTHAQYDAVPVVALTASVMNEEIDLLREAGFQSGIAKPLNLEEFPDLIERVKDGEHLWYVW